MYRKFYGLREKPFEITPDPKFLYLSENHKEALAHLTYAVRERKGFTVVTGEVGTGKTTLVQTLLSRMDGNTRTAYLFNPMMGSTDFLHYICQDLGLNSLKRSKGQYLSQLHKFLMSCYSRNENVVLIVDEAHKLDPKLLEEIRLLTNLETAKSKLLQVILIGQPELNGILEDPQFRQLKQRVSLRYHVHPLNKEDTQKYIKRRLRIAGAFDHNLFTLKAFDKIYSYTKGLPRLINIVCDNALLTGYATDQKVIGDKIIRDVISNLEGVDFQRKKKRWKPFLAILIAALMVCLTILLWKAFFSEMLGDLTKWKYTGQGFAEKVYEEVFKKILRNSF
jgi:general secretion pathway protein A